MDVLDSYRIPVLQSVTVQSKEEAIEAAEKLGYPVVLKVIASQISHKSDAGGVRLNLLDGKSLVRAYKEIITRIQQFDPDAQIDGMMVQPMLSQGHELILGGRQDPQFGPVVMIGLGGIFVEIFNEVVVRVAPLSHRTAIEMLKSMRGYPVLKGVRGQQPADIEAIVDTILKLSQLLCEFPQIRELDINPLSALPKGQGVSALDARIIIKR